MRARRIDRIGFLVGCIFFLLLQLIFLLSVETFLPNLPDFVPDPYYRIVLVGVLAVICVVIFEFIGLSTRRLHDLGLSGLWNLLLIVPFVNFMLLAVLAAMPGKKDINQYGPPPMRTHDPRVIMGWKDVPVQMMFQPESTTQSSENNNQAR